MSQMPLSLVSEGTGFLGTGGGTFWYRNDMRIAGCAITMIILPTRLVERGESEGCRADYQAMRNFCFWCLHPFLGEVPRPPAPRLPEEFMRNEQPNRVFDALEPQNAWCWR